MRFSEVMAKMGDMKQTENGAVAYETANQGALVDLFGCAGALRPRTENEIVQKFERAFRENNLLATKMLFYIGDIRQGGLGERRTFRICLKWMAEKHPEIVKKNIELIPHFNRFDSWFVLVGTPCEQLMWETVAETLYRDIRAMKQSKKGAIVPISLLAKWMPSENTSSADTRRMAMKAMQAMSMNPRTYRKMLSALRKHINVVERQMSAGQWSEIDYEKVPSYAMHNYGSAFAKHDYARFNEFLNKVNSGEKKIHAATLFPYDLIHDYMTKGYGEDRVIESQWKALPNYLDKEINAVIMADVSGSMMGRPMDTSIGLAIYFAQHNQGEYHNKYMTFTDQPHFVNIREGDSLLNNVLKVRRSDVGYNTDLEAAFNYLLNHAISNNVNNADMPKAIVVISDMEIDRYMRYGRYLDFVDMMKQKFARAGYTMPKLVLWNVEARSDTYLSQDPQVINISGQSPAAFRLLCDNLSGVTTYDLMLRALNGEAYRQVRI